MTRTRQQRHDSRLYLTGHTDTDRHDAGKGKAKTLTAQTRHRKERRNLRDRKSKKQISAPAGAPQSAEGRS